MRKRYIADRELVIDDVSIHYDRDNRITNVCIFNTFLNEYVDVPSNCAQRLWDKAERALKEYLAQDIGEDPMTLAKAAREEAND